VTAEFLMVPATPPKGEYEQVERGGFGRQMLATFPNGYGASIIQGPYSYGGPEGKYEIAVMHPSSLCYASPVTSDVIGWQSPEQVVAKLHEIAALPRNDECTHERDHDSWEPRWDDDEESGEAGLGSVFGSLFGSLGSGGF
jgi:hypothetical protein